jgi:ABC-2 type transport system permease protein
MMRNISVVIRKQIKDTFKNKTILIQFILFPLMTIIMENTITMNDMPELFFTRLFSVMYIGMAPLTSAAAIISEEKERNTLRVLMMANVKPAEYIIGVGLYVWSICMIGAGVMASGIPAENVPKFLGVMAVGFVISIIAGSCIGIFAKNQMAATSLVMPVMMVLSFVPMISIFNDTVARISKIFYTKQIMNLMDGIILNGSEGVGRSGTAIIIVNFALFIVLFSLAYHKKGLE